PVLCVKGATVNLYAYGGETGFAVRPGEVGTLGTLSLLKQTGQNTGAVVRVGKGAVWPTTVFVEAGTLYSHATNTLTTLKLTGGEGQAFTETDSTGAITGVDIGEGGKFFHRGTGGIAAATVRASSTFSLAQDARDKTLDEVVAYAGATIDLDNGKADSITHSGGGTNVPTIYCVDGIGTVTIKAPAGMSLNIR
ncbi:MAG TPA: hypothetical protein VGE74_17920, partial [Gemmata sp.]